MDKEISSMASIIHRTNILVEATDNKSEKRGHTVRRRAGRQFCEKHERGRIGSIGVSK